MSGRRFAGHLIACRIIASRPLRSSQSRSVIEHPSRARCNRSVSSRPGGEGRIVNCNRPPRPERHTAACVRRQAAQALDSTPPRRLRRVELTADRRGTGLPQRRAAPSLQAPEVGVTAPPDRAAAAYVASRLQTQRDAGRHAFAPPTFSVGTRHDCLALGGTRRVHPLVRLIRWVMS